MIFISKGCFKNTSSQHKPYIFKMFIGMLWKLHAETILKIFCYSKCFKK